MRLPTSTPSVQGVDAAGIEEFLDALDDAGLELHSFALARHGHVVAEGWWEPYRPDRVHLLYSLSKSLTATVVATLVADGTIGIDDPVLRHLPTEGLEVDPRWEPVLIKHCLSMTVGHTEDTLWPVLALALSGEANGFLAATLRTGPDAEPGTVFCYNQPATYLLSRAVTHVTGHSLSDALRERILDPLGVGELWWQRDAEGFELGFTGAHLATRDLLSIVQLWLDRGHAGDTQLIPAAWYDAAAVPFLQVPPGEPPDWNCGYGYAHWIARHGFRGDGAYGQFGLVLPEHDVAVAMTSEVVNMQAVLDLVWAHLLPAFDGAGTEAADTALADRLASLAIAPLTGASGEPSSGSFELEAGSDLPADFSSVTVTPSEGGHNVTFTVAGSPTSIPIGDGAWADGALVLGDRSLPTASSGSWQDGRFVARVRIVETAHSLRIEADPATGSATVRWILPPLTGPDPRLLAVHG